MKHKALLIKALSTLGVSVLIIMVGHTDYKYLFTRFFVLDLLLTSACVLLVFEYIDRMTRWLDGERPWSGDFFRRLILQLFFGVMVPMMLTLILAWLQFRFVYGYQLTETTFLVVEFPLVILILIITNLVYIVVYLYGSSRRIAAPHKTDTPVILARRGQQNFPVPYANVIMIRLRKVPYLLTMEGKEFLLQENLEYYENELPAHSFFRANRQVIIHRQACASFSPAENGKIRVELSHPQAEPIIISQRRAARFRAWIRQ